MLTLKRRRLKKLRRKVNLLNVVKSEVYLSDKQRRISIETHKTHVRTA
jgi:hypothetical protein